MKAGSRPLTAQIAAMIAAIHVVAIVAGEIATHVPQKTT
jgi:hypothetical protein